MSPHDNILISRNILCKDDNNMGFAYYEQNTFKVFTVYNYFQAISPDDPGRNAYRKKNEKKIQDRNLFCFHFTLFELNGESRVG